MGKRDDYLWHGMFIHYVFLWVLLVAFLWFRGATELLTPQNLISLFIVIVAGDLVIHSVIKELKLGTKR